MLDVFRDKTIAAYDQPKHFALQKAGKPLHIRRIQRFLKRKLNEIFLLCPSLQPVHYP